MPSFIIEARNVAYQRVSLVESYTNFEAIIRHNAVGSWSFTVPANAPEVTYLQPGNGIIVRVSGQTDPAFSGPITRISRSWGESDQGLGSITVSGVTDDQLLFERVTYPIPANDLDNQTDDRFIIIAQAGLLMQTLVEDNCGPLARPERIYPELDIAPDIANLGETATVSARFSVLGEALQEVANSQGLGFRVRQGLNDRLLFNVFEPQDKRDLVFGRQYGNLQSFSYDIEAPTATRVIFACQGEGKDRYFEDRVHDTTLTETWDDRDERILYSGATTPGTDSESYRGTYTDLAAADADFVFYGTGFRVYGVGLPDISDNFVTVDGVVQEWDIPPTTEPRSLLLEVSNLVYDRHTIKLASAEGFRLDYIEILDQRNVSDWRRNSERFYDRRDIPVGWDPTHTSLIDPSEGTPADPNVYIPMLDQAELEAWDENGPKATLSMVPIDTDTVKYGRDYQVGDIVSVDIDGVIITDVLREVRLSDDSDGPRITPIIGDTQATSTPSLYRTVRQLWRKVRKLEAQ